MCLEHDGSTTHGKGLKGFPAKIHSKITLPSSRGSLIKVLV